MTMDTTMTTCQQNCLDAATALAAAGKYDSALEMLRGVTSPDLALPASMLRAKVHAQLSEYADAQREWENALSAAPDNDEAQRGLRLTKRLGAAGRSRLLLRARLHYGALIALVVVLIVALAWVITSDPAAGTGSDTAQWLALRNRELQATLELAETMQTSIAAADTRNREASRRFHAALEAAGDTNASLARQIGAESDAIRHLGERLDAIDARQADVRQEQDLLAKNLADQTVAVTSLTQSREQLPGLVEKHVGNALDAHARECAGLLAQISQQVVQLEEKADGQVQTITEGLRTLEGDRDAMARELALMRESLSATRDDLGDLGRALSRETADLKGSLRYVLTTLAPEGGETYPERLQRLQNHTDQLRSELQMTGSGGIPGLASLMRCIRTAKLRAAETDLRMLEDAYEEDVAPWRRAMEAVEPSPGFREERPPAVEE